LPRDQVARSAVRPGPHLELPAQPGSAVGVGGGLLMARGAAACVLLMASAALGCRQDMHDQPKYKPFRRSTFFGDERSARPLVEDPVARGQLRADAAYFPGKQGTMPIDQLPVPVTPALMQRGRERFTIYCTPCHGQTGRGDGMVVQRGYRRPPSFHIDRLRNE